MAGGGGGGDDERGLICYQDSECIRLQISITLEKAEDDLPMHRRDCPTRDTFKSIESSILQEA